MFDRLPTELIHGILRAAAVTSARDARDLLNSAQISTKFWSTYKTLETQLLQLAVGDIPEQSVPHALLVGNFLSPVEGEYSWDDVVLRADKERVDQLMEHYSRMLRSESMFNGIYANALKVHHCILSLAMALSDEVYGENTSSRTLIAWSVKYLRERNVERSEHHLLLATYNYAFTTTYSEVCVFAPLRLPIFKEHNSYEPSNTPAIIFATFVELTVQKYIGEDTSYFRVFVGEQWSQSVSGIELLKVLRKISSDLSSGESYPHCSIPAQAFAEILEPFRSKYDSNIYIQKNIRPNRGFAPFWKRLYTLTRASTTQEKRTEIIVQWMEDIVAMKNCVILEKLFRGVMLNLLGWRDSARKLVLARIDFLETSKRKARITA